MRRMIACTVAIVLYAGAALFANNGIWIRANQIGYYPNDPKVAILSSDQELSGKFRVGDFADSIGPDQGSWGPFEHNYRLDFSKVIKPGKYQVVFGDNRSLPFRIGNDVYSDVPDKLLGFMRLQRCGDNPVTGEKCHQHDAIDTVTGKPVDLVGGWHDAADRIKHMITTSYCVAALQLSGCEGEAKYGAELIRKIHPDADTVYVQIGDDRDHGPPAVLWHEDQTDYGWGAGGGRSAWPATGVPDGPKYKNESTGVASLAARCSACMSLTGDIEKAKSLYALACRKPGCAMSVPVKAPHYYGESTFYDDLEWAAVELFIRTREDSYLQQAIEYAEKAGVSQWMGKARHGHYEFFPYVNLAHWRLYGFADEKTKAQLAGYYRTGLQRVEALAAKNPYGLGTPLVWCSCNDVVAAATQAVLYEQMTGDKQFRRLATAERDWIFGCNPWGVSLVIGVPEKGVSASRPHHLFHKLAGILPTGGLVDGPVYKDINDALKFGEFGDDPFARFQSEVGVYHDSYMDFSTNEPIIDGTVSLLFLLSEWQ